MFIINDLSYSSVPTCRFVGDKSVYLVAATLRPETMYGQTNCWLHPTIPYVAYESASGDIFISTRRAAINMSYQGITKEENQVKYLAVLTGQVLMKLIT